MDRTVTATELPENSALWARVEKSDFLDCYRVQSDLPVRQAADIITTFPDWAQLLMRIRGIITAPFGLDNEGPAAKDKVGIFPVESCTETELVAGFDDRHLEFRVSVLSIAGSVYMATWVQPHNIGGRLYLALIYPFHVLIVRNALARVARGRKSAP